MKKAGLQVAKKASLAPKTVTALSKGEIDKPKRRRSPSIRGKGAIDVDTRCHDLITDDRIKQAIVDLRKRGYTKVEVINVNEVIVR